MEDANKREFTRVETTMEVELVADTVRIQSSLTRDVSLKGIFIVTPDRLPVGTACEIHIYLGGKDSGCEVRATGRVVRTVEEGLGVEFTEIRGLESFDHLRNLILYNASDTTSVETEFESHLGIKPLDRF